MVHKTPSFCFLFIFFVLSSSTSDDIEVEIPNLITVYKNGTSHRFPSVPTVPPSTDPVTGVKSKDVVISQETYNLSARLYIPKTVNPNHKLPLLVYFYGSGFFIGSPYTKGYHHYLNRLVSEANVVAVSLDYRLAPEHRLPTAYRDSWIMLEWIESHINGGGTHGWLEDYVDYENVFFAGDSSGANVAYNMAMRLGSKKLVGLHLRGIILVQPFFWGKDRIPTDTKNSSQIWYLDTVLRIACPKTGCNPRWINPNADPNMYKLGCKRVLIFVAGEDPLAPRGWAYYRKLRKSRWGGKVEIMEADGEKHVFHLRKKNDNSVAMEKGIVSFLKNQ